MYLEKSDVFAFGSLLFKLLMGKGYFESFFSITNDFKDDQKEDHPMAPCGPAFFTCIPTRSARLAFYCEKLIF